MADLTGIGSILEFGGKLIDRLWPDKAQADAAKLELFKLQQSGELAVMQIDAGLAMAQNKVNEAEATNPNVFVSGWRPAAGWVCVLGMSYHFVFRPMLHWASIVNGWEAPPMIPTDDLMVMLTGMLGLGGYRSWERTKGKHRV